MKSILISLLSFSFLLSLLTVLAVTANATESIIEQQTGAIAVDEASDEVLGFSDGALIVAPIPFSNPMIGSGLLLGAGYLFQLDAESKPSVIGLGGMKSDNGSQAFAAAVRYNFNSNRWQLSLGGGKADVAYDLFVGDIAIPVRQDGILAHARLMYGIRPDLSFGLSSRYLDTKITTQTPLFPTLPPSFQPNTNAAILNLGVEGLWDTRNDPIYPTNGLRLNVTAQRGFIVDGAGTDYSKGVALLDTYTSLDRNTVLAMRTGICQSSSASPFFDSCSLGGFDAFRGFNATRILGESAISTQIEVRRRFGDRFGGVVFAGIGAVGPKITDLTETGAAVGLGVRYRVSKKFPVDYSIDGTYNDQKNSLLYIYISQRF